MLIRIICSDQVYPEFQCKRSKECIPYSKMCDGTENCDDASDEFNEYCVGKQCSEESFRCGYGACIAKTAACNHAIDCRDGSDELSIICNNWHNISAGKTWDISRWKITNASSAHYSDDSLPPTATAELGSEERSCLVPSDDNAIHLQAMYHGFPYIRGDPVPHRMAVRLSCNANHVLQGVSVNTCENGKWRAPWAECIRICERSRITNDASIKAICSYEGRVIDCLKDNLLVNTIAETECAVGYKSERAAS
ncbi:hypothetical protein KR093_005663, partial [Drosophila rubida]